MVWNHLLNCQNNMPKSLWGNKQTNKQQYGHLVDPIVKSVWLLLLESGLGGPTSLMNSIPVSFLIWILSVCMCVCVCVCKAYALKHNLPKVWITCVHMCLF